MPPVRRVTVNAFKWVVLGTAAVSLTVGVLLLRLRRQARRAGAPSRARLVTAWMVLALVPVCVVFLFFPDSSVTGKFGWGEAGGAIAAYLVIWSLAVHRSFQGDELDAREAALAARERRVATGEAVAAAGPGSRTDLPSGDVSVFELAGRRSCRIGVVPGRVEDIRFAQIWVNSENTNMQMARYYDRSLSGTIRYLGARKDTSRRPIEDVIARELRAARGDDHVVEPATVFTTGSGELANSHNVQHLVHVAAVTGEPGVGYRPVANIHACAIAALREAERLAQNRTHITSVSMPLLGAGTGGGSHSDIAQAVINASLDFLEGERRGRIRTVYLLTLLQIDHAACRELLGANDRVCPEHLIPRNRLNPST
jgi:O-acetyl-ADP-ribose deacetylase (regulator of RNase III)